MLIIIKASKEHLRGYLRLLFFGGSFDALLRDEGFQDSRVGVLGVAKVQDLCKSQYDMDWLIKREKER